jgi:hypothetical protein
MIQSIHEVDFWAAHQTTSYHLFEDCVFLDIARAKDWKVSKLAVTPLGTKRVRCLLCEARLKAEFNV